VVCNRLKADLGLHGADNSKHKSLKDSLKNLYSCGRDEYPASTTHLLTLLENFRACIIKLFDLDTLTVIKRKKFTEFPMPDPIIKKLECLGKREKQTGPSDQPKISLLYVYSLK
jgi:hypothetical protein